MACKSTLISNPVLWRVFHAEAQTFFQNIFRSPDTALSVVFLGALSAALFHDAVTWNQMDKHFTGKVQSLFAVFADSVGVAGAGAEEEASFGVRFDFHQAEQQLFLFSLRYPGVLGTYVEPVATDMPYFADFWLFACIFDDLLDILRGDGVLAYGVVPGDALIYRVHLSVLRKVDAQMEVLGNHAGNQGQGKQGEQQKADYFHETLWA